MPILAMLQVGQLLLNARMSANNRLLPFTTQVMRLMATQSPWAQGGGCLASYEFPPTFPYIKLWPSRLR